VIWLRLTRRLLLGSATALFLGALLSLGAVSRAQETPQVTITSPASGETVDSQPVLRWTAAGLTIVPAAEATEQEQTHFHVFVDQEPNLSPGTVWGVEAVHTGAYELPLVNLGPGTHTVWVAVGYRDHTPYQPPVVDSVTFIVP
jgi:hypothetical protein